MKAVCRIVSRASGDAWRRGGDSQVRMNYGARSDVCMLSIFIFISRLLSCLVYFHHFSCVLMTDHKSEHCLQMNVLGELRDAVLINITYVLSNPENVFGLCSFLLSVWDIGKVSTECGYHTAEQTCAGHCRPAAVSITG